MKKSPSQNLFTREYIVYNVHHSCTNVYVEDCTRVVFEKRFIGVRPFSLLWN